jgi:hypothetical protein
MGLSQRIPSKEVHDVHDVRIELDDFPSLMDLDLAESDGGDITTGITISESENSLPSSTNSALNNTQFVPAMSMAQKAGKVKFINA